MTINITFTVNKTKITLLNLHLFQVNDCPQGKSIRGKKKQNKAKQRDRITFEPDQQLSMDLTTQRLTAFHFGPPWTLPVEPLLSSLLSG